MKFNSKLAAGLGIPLWQLRSDNQDNNEIALSEVETQLLTNILKSIGIDFNYKNLKVEEASVAYHTDKLTLVFENIDNQDSKQVLNLAKLSEMDQNKELKKKTWFKLKKEFL